MLVLSRRTQEAVVVGDDIEITVVQVRGNVVRLGISAPDDVTVLRSELWDSLGRNEEGERGVNTKPKSRDDNKSSSYRRAPNRLSKDQ
ncbi:MAG: carbon storage regulator CsrA [Pirellulales bacterium]|nr:carbon storage regulator CsrA [Pirellulales bacterium]